MMTRRDILSDEWLHHTEHSVKGIPTSAKIDLPRIYIQLTTLIELFPEEFTVNAVNSSFNLIKAIEDGVPFHMHKLVDHDEDGFLLGVLYGLVIRDNEKHHYLFIGHSQRDTTPIEVFSFSLEGKTRLIAYRQLQVKNTGKRVMAVQGSNLFVNIGDYVVSNMERYRPIVYPVRNGIYTQTHQPIEVYTTKVIDHELYTEPAH